MSVPPKHRKLGDFPAYYSGQKKAPYLTLFIGGNHEAPSYLAELYYGGWVAPNMYYLGPANVLRFGPLRIAGLSGIWKEHDYHKPHHERLPFSRRDVKSFYSQREVDVRKLLLLREPVDVGLSHDWPQDIVRHGDLPALLRDKPWFGKESKDGRLGSPAAKHVMDRLRPAHWFSAHLHCRFDAVKVYEGLEEPLAVTEDPRLPDISQQQGQREPGANPDEIDLDESDVDGIEDDAGNEEPKQAHVTEQEPSRDDPTAQLPPTSSELDQDRKPRPAPGQPVPPTITNTKTRFLALDKCLPGRKCIELVTVAPLDTESLSRDPPSPSSPPKKPGGGGGPRFRLSYDAEWLAIQRAFAPTLVVGSGDAESPPAPSDLGEAAYRELVDRERAWVDEHVVRAGKLAVPNNFVQTAPPHRPGRDPATVDRQPEEYTNPQTTAFCRLLGVEDHWDASAEERAERRARGPLGPPPVFSEHGGGGGGGGGGGSGGGGGKGGKGKKGGNGKAWSKKGSKSKAAKTSK